MTTPTSSEAMRFARRSQRTRPTGAMLLAIGILTAGDAMATEKLAYRTIEQDGPKIGRAHV